MKIAVAIVNIETEDAHLHWLSAPTAAECLDAAAAEFRKMSGKELAEQFDTPWRFNVLADSLASTMEIGQALLPVLMGGAVGAGDPGVAGELEALLGRMG